MPLWLGFVIWGAGSASALVLIALGLFVVARGALELADQASRYSLAPMERELEDLEWRLERVQSRIDEVPALLERGRRALLVLRDSRVQIAAVAESVNFVAQVLRAVVLAPKKQDS